MSSLLRQVLADVRRWSLFRPGDSVVLGVSGGPDSLCLLHVLTRLAPGLDLRLHVAHLNHGLRGSESDADADFVREIARAWQLPFLGERVDVAALAQEQRLSVEEAARQARYSFLWRTAIERGARCVAVGHHADDQAETVLMHFLRGSGVAGLRGMRPSVPLADLRGLSNRPAPAGATVQLVRPLLYLRRADIEAYCREEHLEPRFDRSNEDTTFYRNRLRGELLPILRTYNPGIDDVLAHTAEVMAGDFGIVAQATEEAMRRVETPARPEEVCFRMDDWRELPLGLQRSTVRAAVTRLRSSLRNINWEHVEHAVQVARRGETGASATIAGGLALTVDYDTLRISAEGQGWAGPVPQVAAAVELAAPGTTALEGGWQVEITAWAPGEITDRFPANDDPWTAYLDAQVTGEKLVLRPRQPGDRFQPHGLGGHSARVNETMINRKTPLAARGGWPILVGAQGIAWVCGLRIDERAAIRPDTQSAWCVRFRP